MIWGGFGVIDIVRFPLSLLPQGEGLGCEWLWPLSLLPRGEGSGMREPSARRVDPLAPSSVAFGDPFAQREKGPGASLRLRRPVHIVAKGEREKLRSVAGRVGDRPRSLAKDVLVFACSTKPLDRAGFRTLVGH